ncbi:MAG: nitronate monooxygenase [Syntrophales bacterium]
MFKTRVTELLKIRYPILMGAMHRLSSAEMVGAIAEAGGMGFIPAAAFADAGMLRKEIRRAKDLTDKPIGLNISLIPSVHPGERIREIIETGIEEKVGAFETAGGSPESFLPGIREAKIPVIHKVPQVRYAKKAEALGVDTVILIGFEGGGFIGPEEITTMTLANHAARSLSIPVIAAGGIVDGRGLIAALALGAEGVLMGTRFIASREARLHENFQNWMTATKEGDTKVLLRSFNSPIRVIRNGVTEKVAEMEKEGKPIADIFAVVGPAREIDCHRSGDTEGSLFGVGQGVTLIDEVKGIKEIIADIIAEAEEVVGRIRKIAAGQET